MGHGPIRVGPMDPGSIQVTIFPIRPSKNMDHSRLVNQVGPIFPPLGSWDASMCYSRAQVRIIGDLASDSRGWDRILEADTYKNIIL